MSKSIQEIEEEIAAEFGMLDGDMEMTLAYIMELGEKMPAFPEAERTEDNIVKGCQSKVWLTADEADGCIHFKADSNTAITKGLVSLLVRVLSGQPKEDIIKAELDFVHRIGMNRFIGTQRSNGFAAMIKQMKLYAVAYSARA
jgi:cysteine desulfuration protein SufE